MHQNWTHLPHLYSLIGNERLKESHLLNRLSNDDVQIINDALGIVIQKVKAGGNQERKLQGDVRHPRKFVGLSSELFWCYRLTQLGYSFDLEAGNGGPDFRFVLDQRGINAEVKTLQKEYGSNQRNNLNLRLKKTIEKEIKNFPDTFLIVVHVGRDLSDKTVKPLAAEIREYLEKMSLYQKRDTFKYPIAPYGYPSNQAKVTIKRCVGEKTNILISSPAFLANDEKLLKRTLGTARKQFNQNGVNIVFIDKTFRSILDDEDIQNALYGKLVHDVSFDRQSGEPKRIVPHRENNGFYHTSSRISAIVVYERRRWGMLGIQEANIYPHPESCKLTEAEMEALERLSGR